MSVTSMKLEKLLLVSNQSALLTNLFCFAVFFSHCLTIIFLFCSDVADVTDVTDVDVEEEVLELAELPELTDTGDLGQQDGSLLEGHDLTNVLNEIPTIAFTDLFGGKFTFALPFEHVMSSK